MDHAMSATIRMLIDRVVRGERGNAFDQEAALQYDALPLHHSWTGWVLLTVQGEVLEADEESGEVSPVSEPNRTVLLVDGAETYPELILLLPVRTPLSKDCTMCAGTGRMDPPGGKGRFWCGECRALGWVEVPP